MDNLCWPHTPWVSLRQDRACCPGPVPAAIPWAIISDSIGEDRPPGMSQLAPLCYLLSQSWKNYVVHLAVLAAAGFSFLFTFFFKKQKVTPLLTAIKSTLLVFCVSHCNNNPLHLMSLYCLQSTFLYILPFGPCNSFGGERRLTLSSLITGEERRFTQ